METATNKGFCIRVWAISKSSESHIMCAEVYYKTEGEAQDKLYDIRQCMVGVGPTTIRVGDAIIRGEKMDCVRLFQAGQS